MGNSERTKNALGTTSSISIIGWIPGRISPTCCATRSRCTSSTTILTTRLKSQAFAPLFLVGHPALPTGSSKPTSFPDKIAKKIYNQPCAVCRPIRVRDQPQDREGAWHQHSAIAAYHSRRGDRMRRREFVALFGGVAT